MDDQRLEIAGSDISRLGNSGESATESMSPGLSAAAPAGECGADALPAGGPCSTPVDLTPPAGSPAAAPLPEARLLEVPAPAAPLSESSVPEGPALVCPGSVCPGSADPVPVGPQAEFFSAPGRDAAWCAQEASAALEAFRLRCPPLPAVAGPLTWLSVSEDCRRTPADPAATLAELRQEFPDRVLRAAQLITGPPGSPTLAASLAPRQPGFVLPVRASAGGQITDLLTPSGLLSSPDMPPFLVPILPARSDSLPAEGMIFGTFEPHEALLLHSLDLPVVLLRRARRLNLAALPACGSFQVTAVAGCRPLLESAVATSTAAPPPSSVSPPSPWLLILGFSFLAGPCARPRGIRAVFRFVRYVRDRLGVDLGEGVLVAAPRREQLLQLAERLRWRDAARIRDWFLDQGLLRLVSWDQYHALCVPQVRHNQFPRPYDVVRSEIQMLLQYTSRIWSSFDLEFLQRQHDELMVAVKRLLEPWLDRAALAGDLVTGCSARLLESTFRAWLIVEPYAYVAHVPPQLRLGIDLGGLSVRDFCAAQEKKLGPLVHSQVRALGPHRTRAL